MEAKNVRSVLRILAITCVLVGIILTNQLFGSGISLSRDLGDLSIYGVFSQLTIVAWGAALYAASSKLSEMIVD